MARYALLVRESSNRVFGQAAPKLLAAEVEAIGAHLSCSVSNGLTEDFGSLSYYCFDAAELTEADIFILSNLALARGLFEKVDQDALRPIDVEPLAWFESDLVTIQRYAGKTNEQFTHLLVNLALAASRSAHQRASVGQRVSLLDPVSGRGSTLNRGLLYGFDAFGVEVDAANVDQHRIFLSSYLKDHRVKHKVETERFRKGDLAGSSAFSVAVRPPADAWSQRVRVVRGPTERTAEMYPGKRFDVIAGDLPYGIRHGSKQRAEQVVDAEAPRGGERSPERLVRDSLRGWRKVMAKGGSLALSWNLKTLPRETLENLVVDAGLEVIEHPLSFEHRVDRQITRDVLVGRSPVV